MEAFLELEALGNINCFCQCALLDYIKVESIKSLKKKKSPQNSLAKPDQVINRLECCGGQVSAGIRENRGVLALSEGDSLHWNISGEESRTGAANTMLQREGLIVCWVSASKFTLADLC